MNLLFFKAYGKGVYFARDSSLSHFFTNLEMISKADGDVSHGHIFVCKILVGYCVAGYRDINSENLPAMADNLTKIDSTVDNTYDQSIVAIYNDSQAYPQYLILYC